METVGEAKRADGVSFVIDPYQAKAISKDGRIGYADVIYPMPADEVSDSARDELEESAGPAKQAGMEVEFGGGLVTDESEAGSESAGILIGFLVLAITLGLARGGRAAAADGDPRRGDLGRHGHRPHRLDRADGDGAHAGHDARPGGRHRLRAVHPEPLPAERRQRHGAARRGRPGDRHRGQRRRVRRRDRRDRAGRTDGRQHPVPDGHGPRGGGRRGDRGPDRHHPAAGAARLLRAPGRADEPGAHVAAVAAPRRPRGGERALRALRDAAAVGRAGRRPGGAPRGRAAGDAHEARPAGRRLEADRQHRAQGVRPAERGLRPRLQRRADRRGRRARAAARAAEAAGQRRRRGAGGLPARGGRLASGSERARRRDDRPGHAHERSRVRRDQGARRLHARARPTRSRSAMGSRRT